jgi:hypothetical protein
VRAFNTSVPRSCRVSVSGDGRVNPATSNPSYRHVKGSAQFSPREEGGKLKFAEEDGEGGEPKAIQWSRTHATLSKEVRSFTCMPCLHAVSHFSSK